MKQYNQQKAIKMKNRDKRCKTYSQITWITYVRTKNNIGSIVLVWTKKDIGSKAGPCLNQEVSCQNKIIIILNKWQSWKPIEATLVHSLLRIIGNK